MALSLKHHSFKAFIQARRRYCLLEQTLPSARAHREKTFSKATTLRLKRETDRLGLWGERLIYIYLPLLSVHCPFSIYPKFLQQKGLLFLGEAVLQTDQDLWLILLVTRYVNLCILLTLSRLSASSCLNSGCQDFLHQDNEGNKGDNPYKAVTENKVY